MLFSSDSTHSLLCANNLLGADQLACCRHMQRVAQPAFLHQVRLFVSIGDWVLEQSESYHNCMISQALTSGSTLVGTIMLPALAIAEAGPEPISFATLHGVSARRLFKVAGQATSCLLCCS